MENYIDEFPSFTEVVTWPESQMILEKEGALENCALINSDHGQEIYGSSAYRVNPEWYQKLLNGELNNMSQEETQKWRDGEMNIDTSFPFDTDDDEDEDEEYVCPECGSTDCRYYLDVTDCGDIEGYHCNDCGYEGSKSEFLSNE